MLRRCDARHLFFSNLLVLQVIYGMHSETITNCFMFPVSIPPPQEICFNPFSGVIKQYPFLNWWVVTPKVLSLVLKYMYL